MVTTVATWGERFQSLIIFLVIAIFGSVLVFYVYNYFMGVGSVTGIITVFLIGAVAIAIAFLSQGFGKKTLDSEVLLLTLIIVGVTIAFFIYGGTISDFLGSIAPSNFQQTFSGLRP